MKRQRLSAVHAQLYSRPGNAVRSQLVDLLLPRPVYRGVQDRVSRAVQTQMIIFAGTRIVEQLMLRTSAVCYPARKQRK